MCQYGNVAHVNYSWKRVDMFRQDFRLIAWLDAMHLGE